MTSDPELSLTSGADFRFQRFRLPDREPPQGDAAGDDHERAGRDVDHPEPPDQDGGGRRGGRSALLLLLLLRPQHTRRVSTAASATFQQIQDKMGDGNGGIGVKIRANGFLLLFTHRHSPHVITVSFSPQVPDARV